MTDHRLGNIRVVLVEPSHPANVGLAARALKTMGLGRLELVAPRTELDDTARSAAAHADDLLAGAGQHADLGAALAGATLVVGLSARPRRLGAPVLECREAAALLVAEAARQPVAVLLGRERSGLTNGELLRCHYAARIPANPDYPVLNLAAAVQIIAYELRLAAVSAAPAASPVRQPADDARVQAFLALLRQLAGRSGFLYRHNPEVLMARLQALFQRARPEVPELNALHGLLASLERILDPPRDGSDGGGPPL